tara:strand:+ start:224 stop:412 length:189 start_codon:yes stop_codon:yes gene_type:complete
MAMTKIYESPDKGQTVYEREFGAPHSSRVEIKRPNRNGKGIEGNTEMEEARRVSKTWSMEQD